MFRSWLYFSLLFVVAAKSTFPLSLRRLLPVSSNQIVDAGVECDFRNFNITVKVEQPFKGVIFAKDFSQECNSFGTLTNSISISLPTSGCGIRLSSRKVLNTDPPHLFYSVVLVLQQDRHLRQIADVEKIFECTVSKENFNINSEVLMDAIQADFHSKGIENHRSGRMKKDELDENLDGMAVSKAWMEISSENLSGNSERLQVGEMALLSVKTTLPSGIGWKIVDCTAHDGLGDSSQKLLDEEGCPIDELLMPELEMGPIHPISLMNHQEAIVSFPAFKFPDRDRLHISCFLELCRSSCMEVDCSKSNSTFDNRLGRTLSKGSPGEIIDRLKVFNSVEVIAPAIDDLRLNDNLPLDPIDEFFSNNSRDKAFCASPQKIAIMFCILGVIFLCAVVVAALALLKSRSNGNDGPFYSRSLFSSSSGGSAYGSKLLLQESPCMGQPAPHHVSYGRIL